MVWTDDDIRRLIGWVMADAEEPELPESLSVANMLRRIKEPQVKKTFAYHKPGADGLKTIAELREAFSKLHDDIERLAPPSREKSVALTNLETTAMWAIKAVVCNDPESEIAP